MEKLKHLLFSILGAIILTACASKKAGCDAYGKNQLKSFNKTEVTK